MVKDVVYVAVDVVVDAEVVVDEVALAVGCEPVTLAAILGIEPATTKSSFNSEHLHLFRENQLLWLGFQRQL